MALLRTIQIDPNFRVGVWETSETKAELQSLCEKKGITFPNVPEKRQRELATEYLLLHEMLGMNAEIVHDSHGAPSLGGDERRVSISHTGGYVVVAIASKDTRMGVDIERFSDRVLRVRRKFLSGVEQATIAEDDVEANIVAWTIKEAVYKAAEMPGIEFANDIKITGGDTAHCGEFDYQLIFQKFDDANLTIAIRKNS